MAKPLFHNLKIQGRFLVKMISLCLSMNDDPVKFKATLIQLTEVHNARGIKSGECKSRSLSSIFLLYA